MMKKTNFLSAIFIVAMAVHLYSCKKDDTSKEEETSNVREASFKVGADAKTVNKPYIAIFNDNGTIKNTMTLTAADGSKVEFYFVGSSPATYPLMSFSNGYYKSSTGKQYNSTSGELVVTSYSVDGSTYKATGTFHFKAKAITAPLDSIEITAGVFTNASNEF